MKKVIHKYKRPLRWLDAPACGLVSGIATPYWSKVTCKKCLKVQKYDKRGIHYPIMENFQ